MNITSFQVSPDKSSLLLNIDNAGTANQLNLWTKLTYKVEELKVDLSNKLSGQFSQSIVITADELDIEYFDGIYFIEVIDMEDNTSCAIAAELTRYKECILDKVLAYKDCDSCLEITYPEVLNAQTLLYTLEKSLELNLIQEVLTLVFALDRFCKKDCKGCGQYKNI